MTIANEFNKFFANIGPNLSNKSSNVDGAISDYLDGSFQKAFVLSILTQLQYKI